VDNDGIAGSGTSLTTTFVMRDIDGKDNKIRVELTWDKETSRWDCKIYDPVTGTTLGTINDTTSTRLVIELPTTKEKVSIDWSNVTHDSSVTDNFLKMPGRTGRIEIGQPSSTSWTSVSLTNVIDANGNTHNIKIWMKKNGSRWDYAVVENFSSSATSPEDETGTILASGTACDETEIYFFLDGTTQRINLDWSDTSLSFDSPVLYTIEEMPTLFDAWNATNDTPIASTEYAYRSTLQIYDSLGTPHEITVYYNPTTRDNVWEFLVTCDPQDDQRDFTNDTCPMYWRSEEGEAIEVPVGAKSEANAALAEQTNPPEQDDDRPF
jgi:flagellar hook protein FlgE